MRQKALNPQWSGQGEVETWTLFFNPACAFGADPLNRSLPCAVRFGRHGIYYPDAAAIPTLGVTSAIVLQGVPH